MMKRIELTTCPVLFNEAEHTYWLGEKELQGITGMLTRQLFPNEYEGISEATLQAAANYGTSVHKSIEKFDADWTNDGTVEVADYISICKEHELTPIASEYLVSDLENWASSIDKVYRTGDNSFSLGDIKTYGSMTADKLQKARWQLSIYAMLFEKQNKGAVVDGLFILHIRNREKKDGTFDHIADFIPIKRIPLEICAELMNCDLNREQFTNPYLCPESVKAQEELIKLLIQTKNEAEEKLATIKASILSQMEEEDIKTWFTDSMRITRKLPTTRESFNLAAFKKANPNLDLTKYMKVSEVKGSLLIAV